MINIGEQSGVELQLQGTINDYRKSKGLSELQVDPVVYEQAKLYLLKLLEDEERFLLRAEDTQISSEFFNNVRRDMLIPVSRVDGCVAFNDNLDPATTAFESLKAFGVCKNKIESGSFTHLGVATMQNRFGMFYFVVFFVQASE
ncbi:hypothetical protein GCM10023331_22080 [Algivirga pacifica]|uniref:Uncharacterized protein n=2 Tax=Algivirga pacifica TaxID=1162670 RepID=A0ABP9DFT9_9BACT